MTTATMQLERRLTISPPSFKGHRNNPHAVAHAALEELRESGDSQFLFLRTIFEHPTSEELLFHCITGSRHVILTRWDAFSEPFTSTIRDFFMSMGDYCTSKIIRMACFTSSVALWKRQWLRQHDRENNRSEVQQQPTRPALSSEELQILERIGDSIPRIPNKAELFHYLNSHMSTHMEATCQYLSSLVGEFSGKSVVPYRLPIEFHKNAHRTFEKESLEDCLKLSMGALSKILTCMPEESIASSVIQVNIDVIGWEFGGAEWMHLPSSKTLIRPPVSWSQYLVRPDFIGAVFVIHEHVFSQKVGLAHGLRQLLLLLCSLTGPIFRENHERQLFAQFLCDGTQKLLLIFQAHPEASLIYDTYSLVARLLSNFRLAILSGLPSFIPLLQSMSDTGTSLLQANLQECERVVGDLASMVNREWRDEALTLLLENIVLLCQDPWLRDPKADESSRRAAQAKLTQTLGQLYTEFVRCRSRMMYLAEFCSVKEEQTSDSEDREDIEALVMEEEMAAVACLGQLHLPSSLSTMSLVFQDVLPKLEAAWQEGGAVTPDVAALLKETSLLITHVGHLLTDESKQDSSFHVSSSVENACRLDEELIQGIASVIRVVLSLMQAQASKIAASPSNPRLSPVLARQFIWFLTRFTLTFVCGASSESSSELLSFWSVDATAKEVIEFCIWLCSQYQCYWHQDNSLQEQIVDFLIAMAKRNQRIRSIMVQSPSFHQMATLVYLSARPGFSSAELEAIAGARNAPVSVNILRGYYHGLPLATKRGILTAVLLASGDDGESSRVVFNECLSAVRTAFIAVVTVGQAQSAEARGMVKGSIEMLCGVVQVANDIQEPKRIPLFICPLLAHLPGLMTYYAEDLSICEGLLRLLRDYSEAYAPNLHLQQMRALVEAVACVLRSYSQHHCATRSPKSGKEAEEEEEQAYTGIICTLELLNHLVRGEGDLPIVTNVIFLGLQQLIPLITLDLLSYPTLGIEYFSLVGFMMESYPNRVSVLPYDLLNALIQSLLQGSSHPVPKIATRCLEGIEGLAKAHAKSGVLTAQLSQHPDLLDRCTRHILQEIVFRHLVFDRSEETSNSLLILIAVDVSRFAVVVTELVAQSTCTAAQQDRLRPAFQKLVKQEILNNALAEGYEGRANRRQFKEDFETFVSEIHAFLVLK